MYRSACVGYNDWEQVAGRSLKIIKPLTQFPKLYVAQNECIKNETCGGVIFNKNSKKYTLSTSEPRVRVKEEIEVTYKKPGNPCERMYIYNAWRVYVTISLYVIT